VDDDIDPANLDELMWAMATRTDPADDIEILRRQRGSRLDPMLAPGAPPFTSRAVIDACRPWERLSSFPKVAQSDPGYPSEVRARWFADPGSTTGPGRIR
jgi:3-polyprenyl-4-hydroxybenzoate decarboxylase